jgi:hypothetical protein
MALRRSVLVAGSLLLSTASVHAVAPRQARRIAAEELTAMPAAGTKPLRAQRMLRASPRPTAAWQRFSLVAGGTWRAAWDAATNVPSRIWGPGLPAPGAMASPAAAEQHARRLLADHLALLAPGAAASDFVLVSNHSDGDIRSVGFQQRAAGRRVVGGQVSFRFKRDRMFLIGSEALPDVRVDLPRARLARTALHARAADNLRRELDLTAAAVSPAGDEEVVLPLVGDHAVYGYRLATPMMIDGGADGRYLAYVDPSTGAVLAVRQQNFYATGTVLYRGIDRFPARGRINRPARRAHVFVGGVAQTTSSNGVVSWSPDEAKPVLTGVSGDLVKVVNKKTDGVSVTAQHSLAPGGQVVWDASANPEDEAQLVTYLATNIVKEYVRNNLDPALPKLDEPLTANVNIAQSCNAFFDGKSINFFHASEKCENTGLLEDVIYHEFGHALHAGEIIDGVGAFDGAMSEGAADFLAASITNDSGMGRGFFYNDKPLRELDPPDGEFSWPKDISEIHATGKIFGGAYWDLRKALIQALGEGPGVALVNRIFLGALRRSVSIPTSLYEALAVDDDDGNLENGTPHECFIRDAYGRHGLRTATGTVAAPGALSDNAAATSVRVDLTGLSSRCAGDEIDQVTLGWKPGYGDVPAAGEAAMTAVGPGQYWSKLPLVRDEVMYYQATVRFKDGSTLTLPDNLGLPFYSLYQGKTVPLYCTSFETDPFAEGWTTGTGDPMVASPWQWGTPTGTGGTDPPAAYSGAGVLGMNLGGDYGAKQSSYVTLPPIDVGRWSDVRLQFRRWLAVEDSHYDEARVMVNGQRAWINFTQDIGDSSAIHHIDREWAFQDVRVSGYAFGHTLNLAFDLSSDEGLHLGGWQLDDLCVVANVKSVCGDGVKSLMEECDDGLANSNAPDATCRTYCRLSSCGDEIVDSEEECDDGPLGTETCSLECERVEPPDTGGCCGASRSPHGSLALAGLVGLTMLRRRRRRGSRRGSSSGSSSSSGV